MGLTTSFEDFLKKLDASINNEKASVPGPKGSYVAEFAAAFPPGLSDWHYGFDHKVPMFTRESFVCHAVLCSIGHRAEHLALALPRYSWPTEVVGEDIKPADYENYYRDLFRFDLWKDLFDTYTIVDVPAAAAKNGPLSYFCFTPKKTGNYLLGVFAVATRFPYEQPKQFRVYLDLVSKGLNPFKALVCCPLFYEDAHKRGQWQVYPRTFHGHPFDGLPRRPFTSFKGRHDPDRVLMSRQAFSLLGLDTFGQGANMTILAASRKIIKEEALVHAKGKKAPVSRFAAVQVAAANNDDGDQLLTKDPVGLINKLWKEYTGHDE